MEQSLYICSSNQCYAYRHRSSQGHVFEQQYLHQPDLQLVAVSLCFLHQAHLHHQVYLFPDVGLNLHNYKAHPLWKEDEGQGSSVKP